MMSMDTASDPKGATKNVANYLSTNIYPLVMKIRNRLHSYAGDLLEEEVSKIREVFALCTSQISKCLHALLDIFMTEQRDGVSLQVVTESRQCTLERLSWCMAKLSSIDRKLDQSNKEVNENDSILSTPVYFVNWIDHTFESLAKLADIIYKTDYKETETLYEIWKSEIVECVSTLHISLDELLLSAMTLCKYCLPADQHVVKARCQVVLRESKALLSELIDGDFNSVLKVTPGSLKLPIMPSNVNVLIEVLKDVLYALETNTNTALLALVINCFSYSQSPVDVLLKHFENSKGTCSCLIKSNDDVTEDCSFVKEFDLYNERLLQIGSFAVSCSSDQSRVLTLRSGLASLEALDPHLVPAIMMSSESHHAKMLVESWRHEVRDIMESTFLIVDPAAFTEKSKQTIHETLLEILKESTYDNNMVCSVINIGCVLSEFFKVYNNLEPEALTQHEKLQPLLADLYKVQFECKVVSNLLSSGNDFVYDVKKSKNNTDVTFDQLLKRLKLLYTIVNRINTLLHPKEDDLFDEVEEEVPKNVTHTIIGKNLHTYVQSPRKPANMSRSLFARTANVRSSTNKFPLQKLTKNLKLKQREQLSFSVQLDELFFLSKDSDNEQPVMLFANKQFDSMKEPSIMYNFSPRKRASLRKAVLNKHYKLPFEMAVVNNNVEIEENSRRSEKGSLIDEATSLQITDILNQMSDITSDFIKKSNRTHMTTGENVKQSTEPNVLRINVNSDTASYKQVWNIPVNASSVEMSLDDSAGTVSSNVTQPSTVTTLERISDIDLVESKLNSLKTSELETSL